MNTVEILSNCYAQSSIPTKIIQIYKNIDTQTIFSFKKGKNKYICKKLTDADLMKTEIQAIKYLRLLLHNHIPKLRKVCNDTIVYDYVPGEVLRFYKDTDMSYAWWIRILKQIVKIASILEKNKILHNDMWDENILISTFDRVVLIDFSYTNQYTTKPNIYSREIMEVPDDNKWKRDLGQSKFFGTGRDLNQILGIIASDYVSVPTHIKDYINKHVIVNPDSNWTFATQKSNPALSPKYVSRILF